MNLARALDVALPELPVRRYRETYFRFNPRTVARVHDEADRKVVRALSPGSNKVMNITPKQWELVKMFDGQRSYPQLAALWKQRCGIAATPEFIQQFAGGLDDVGFWYKTPEEESVTLLEELTQRRESRRKKPTDLSRVYVSVFDPNAVLERTYRYIQWAFSPWFVALTIAGLIWMISTWIARSGEVWRDSLVYWNMADKGLRDVLEFYFMFAFMGFFHECGHAFAVKHFGADVRRMGIMLVYTTPAFFVDSSQVWLYRSRRERCLTILAGFWAELTLCALATFVWTGTSAGTFVHDFAYKFILVAGIMPVLFNLNPLIKLDGYLFVTEFFRLPNLKERSTAYLSAWVRKHLFGMPATVPHLRRRQALLFAVYGIMSGLYSYVVLLFLARLTYRILYNFTPEWAWLPATLVALRIFKSRIEKLMEFLQALYLDKKALLQAHRWKLAATAAILTIALFAPLRHERVQARFVLEPALRAVVRAQVPGEVQGVLVKEGQTVQAGMALAKLKNVNLESEAADVAAQLKQASARATLAQFQYADYGVAEQERQKWDRRAKLVSERQAQLQPRSPILGTIVTPHMENLERSWIGEGSLIAEVQDLSVMRARVFVPEPEMDTLGEVTGQSIFVPPRFSPVRGQLVSVSANAQEIPDGLISVDQYKGTKLPPFYVVLVLVPNPNGDLRAGMMGEAKLYGKRRSLAWLAVRPAVEFVGRKFW